MSEDRLYDIQLRLWKLVKKVEKIEKSLNTVLILLAGGLGIVLIYSGVEIYGILL